MYFPSAKLGLPLTPEEIEGNLKHQIFRNQKNHPNFQNGFRDQEKEI